MKKRILHTLSVLLMLCMMLVFAAVPAKGEVDLQKESSITVVYTNGDSGLVGVGFCVRRVADMSADMSLKPTGDFENYPVVLDPQTAGEQRALAYTLLAYAERDGLSALAFDYTGEDGTVSFLSLTPGLYLVSGEIYISDAFVCTPEPVLVYIPYRTEEGSLTYDAVVYPKKSVKQPDELLTISAVKVWDDEGRESARSQSITVELLRDGEIYASVKLSAENNWRCTWTQLPADSIWLIAEKDVPADYTVLVKPDEYVFFITNTASTDNPPVTDDPILPQTGMRLRPIIIFAAAGMLLAVIGLSMRASASQS